MINLRMITCVALLNACVIQTTPRTPASRTAAVESTTVSPAGPHLVSAQLEEVQLPRRIVLTFDRAMNPETLSISQAVGTSACRDDYTESIQLCVSRGGGPDMELGGHVAARDERTFIVTMSREIEPGSRVSVRVRPSFLQWDDRGGVPRPVRAVDGTTLVEQPPTILSLPAIERAMFASRIAPCPNGATIVTGSRSIEGAPSEAFVQMYDAQYQRQWEQRVSSGAGEMSLGVASHRDAIVVVGSTEGRLADGDAGNRDAFVALFDSSGQLQWTRQFGSDARDWATSVAMANGRIVVAGTTHGAMPGQSFSGSRLNPPSPDVSDVFVARFTMSGRREWLQQFGTAETGNGRLGVEEAEGVTLTRNGDVYVTGLTTGHLNDQRAHGVGEEAFIAKFGASGRLEWTRLLGRRSEGQSITAVSNSTIAVAGFSPARGEGSFVALFDSRGRRRWEQWVPTLDGEQSLWARSIVAQGNRLYVLARRWGMPPTDSNIVPRVGGLELIVDAASGGVISQRHIGQEDSEIVDDLYLGADGVVVSGRMGSAGHLFTVSSEGRVEVRSEL